MRLFACPSRIGSPFNELSRLRKMRCGCDDCVAIAKKFVNVKFPTIIQLESAWHAKGMESWVRRPMLHAHCEYGEYREIKSSRTNYPCCDQSSPIMMNIVAELCRVGDETLRRGRICALSCQTCCSLLHQKPSIGFDAACFARYILLHKLVSSARENPMPERVNSFAPMIPGVLSVLVATVAVLPCSAVRADNACIEQPSPPAAEGTRWSLHYDRAKGRKCWVLVDANGYDVTPPQAQLTGTSTPEAVQTLSSQIASLWGNLTGASANATTQAHAPQVTVPRKTQGNAANAGRTDNGVRAEQRSMGEGHAVKRSSPALTAPEREALFEEFLRWQNQESISALIPRPAAR